MTTLPYIIKSGSVLILLLLYYHLFLKKQTFFQLNRIYLLGILLLATLIPFIPTISVLQKGNNIIPGFSILLEEVYVYANHSPEQNPSISWVYWIYITGIILFSIKYLWALGQIYRLYRTLPHKTIHRMHIIRLPEKHTSFSFFNYLFINTATLNKQNRNKIFEHEKIHICQLHSIDLLVAELLCILNWFNPLVWICKTNIAQNHEYIADKHVIRRFQTGSYLQLLVSQTFRSSISFTNCFSCSNLKKRMIMMTKQQTQRYKIINYVPALLLSSVLFISFTCNATGESPTQPTPTEISVVQKADSIHNVVEVMPIFPSGQVNEWLAKHITYPVDAQKEKAQGTVFVVFVIEKDGTVNDVQIKKGSDTPSLNAEALRIVKSMPKWTPGKNNGQPVRVSYTLPIRFKL